MAGRVTEFAWKFYHHIAKWVEKEGILKQRKRKGWESRSEPTRSCQKWDEPMWSWKLSAFFWVLLGSTDTSGIPNCLSVFIFASITLSVYISGSHTSAYIRITCRLVKRFLDSPHSFWFSRDRRICISNNHQDNADAAGSGTIVKNFGICYSEK